jgi:ribonuclease HIII
MQLVEKAAMSQFNHSKLISRVSTTKKTMATDCLVIDKFYFSFAPQ